MKRAFLTGLGITDGDVIKQIVDYHQGVVQDLKDDLSTLRGELKTANTTITDMKKDMPEDKSEALQKEIDTLKGQIQTMEAEHTEALRTKETEYSEYRKTVEADKLISKKRQAARADLLKRNVSEDVLDDFLLDKLDYDAMEIDGDSIKNPDEFIKPYQEKYAKYFGEERQEGVEVGNPPWNNGDSSGQVFDFAFQPVREPKKD